MGPPVHGQDPRKQRCGVVAPLLPGALLPVWAVAARGQIQGSDGGLIVTVTPELVVQELE